MDTSQGVLQANEASAYCFLFVVCIVLFINLLLMIVKMEECITAGPRGFEPRVSGYPRGNKCLG
ncbi:MAG: hypothetical protein J7L82_00320, partial [Staphylothermus sp.]|nr:hypothetical protein [Staphylothermus sp.]